jgi:hypothetical protein
VNQRQRVMPLILFAMVGFACRAAQPPDAPATAAVSASFRYTVKAFGLYAVVTQGGIPGSPARLDLLFPDARRDSKPASDLAKVEGFYGSLKGLPDHFSFLTVAAKYLAGPSQGDGQVSLLLGWDGQPVEKDGRLRATQGTSIVQAACAQPTPLTGGDLPGVPYQPAAGTLDLKDRASVDPVLLSSSSDPRLAARYTLACGETAFLDDVLSLGGTKVSVKEAVLEGPATVVSKSPEAVPYRRPSFTRTIVGDGMVLSVGRQQIALKPVNGEVVVTLSSVPASEIVQGPDGHAHGYVPEPHLSSYAHTRWLYLLTKEEPVKPFYILEKFPYSGGGDPYCNAQRRLELGSAQ